MYVRAAIIVPIYTIYRSNILCDSFSQISESALMIPILDVMFVLHTTTMIGQ